MLQKTGSNPTQPSGQPNPCPSLRPLMCTQNAITKKINQKKSNKKERVAQSDSPGKQDRIPFYTQDSANCSISLLEENVFI